MTTKLAFAMNGPDWQEIILPDWATERANTVIAALGADHPASQIFAKILAAGKIDQQAVDELDEAMYSLGDPEAFMLAADISTHAFSAIKVMSLTPLKP